MRRVVGLARKAIQRLTLLGLAGDEQARRLGVTVGERVRIYSHHLGSEPWLIAIGPDSIISTGVRFITHDASAAFASDSRGRRFVYGRISIGERSFVGAGAILLPGIRIGDDVVVAAGSVVTRSVPDGCVVGGVPARWIGDTKTYRLRLLAEAPVGPIPVPGPARRAAVTALADSAGFAAPIDVKQDDLDVQ